MNLYASRFLPFLKRCGPLDFPVLIALSGGPDSMALLHMLLEYRKTNSVIFGVAHIDHGWRDKSASEAKQLESLCLENHIPFHLKQIRPEEMKGNLEDACRDVRYQFFKQLCEEQGYQAVLLGHHMDDQAETVLKRVFEGARLERSGGMKEVASIHGVVCWRPFLDVRKKELTAWLETKNAAYFSDPTNDDRRFLRARVRNEILPMISDQFEKDIVPGLSHYGREMHALSDFMNDYIKQWVSRLEKTPSGVLLDIEDSPVEHLFVARYLISLIMPGASREIAYAAGEALTIGAADKCYEASGKVLYLDRGRLFLTDRKIARLSLDERPLEASGTIGCWNYRVVDTPHIDRVSGWKQALYGHLQLPLSEDPGKCMIGSPSCTGRYRKELKGRKNRGNAPAFLRNTVPLVTNEENVVCDFLFDDEGTPADDASHAVILTKNDS